MGELLAGLLSDKAEFERQRRAGDREVERFMELLAEHRRIICENDRMYRYPRKGVEL